MNKKMHRPRPNIVFDWFDLKLASQLAGTPELKEFHICLIITYFES